MANRCRTVAGATQLIGKAFARVNRSVLTCVNNARMRPCLTTQKS